MKNRGFQICFTLLSFVVAAFGQTTGTIGGAVLDPSGAAVPNANVTATSPATGVVVKTTSLSDGKYLFNNLLPDTYTLSADAPGFKTTVRSGIELHVNDKLGIDIALQVGASQESVSVTAEAPILRTEDSQTGEVINNTFISNLPQLNRDPWALVSMSGNIRSSFSTTSTSTNPVGTPTISINGGQTSSTDFYVDGGVVNSGQNNQLTNQTPSMDAVDEFKVVATGISAEVGRISGGYITLVTKSGTNAYHGSAYEYMFNDMFNANAWGQNAIGNPKVHFRQNDYGFTLGGPTTIPKIYNARNKTFFFIDNEYFKNTQAGSVVLSSVPSDAERAGNFESALYQGVNYPVYDPYGPQVFNASNGLWQRTGLIGGDGHIIPPSEISPVSTAILKYVPEPNRPSVANSSELNNYGFASSQSQYNFRLGVRLDENLTQNQRFSLRWSRFDSNLGTSPTQNNALYTSSVTQSNGGNTGNFNYTWTARPTVVVDFHNSVTFQPYFTGTTHPSTSFSNSFLPAIYNQYIPNNIPPVNVTFMGRQNFGLQASNSAVNSTTYDFAGTVTKVLTKHTLKTGYEYRRYYDNFLNAGGSSLNFMVDPVDQFQGDWGLGATNGNILGLASFLLGINDQNNIAQPTTRDMNTNYVGAFVQDDWKVNQKLTLNLGLRWDDELATTERYNSLYFWNPAYPSLYPIVPGFNFAAALAQAGLPANTPVPTWAQTGTFQPGAVERTGTTQYPGRSPQHLPVLQLSPRVGLAYQLNKKTVIRTYGGKMYIGTTGNPNSYATANSSIPLSNQAFAGWHASTDAGRTYISTWATPFPLASMFTSPTTNLLTINNDSSVDPGANAVSADEHMAREYDWSFNIQRQLPMNTVLEVGYAGNRGLGLLASDTISHYPANLLVPQYAASMQAQIASPNAGETNTTTITGPMQQLGLLEYNYPYYGRVVINGINEGMSRYNALTLRVDHRLSKGLQVLVNYTYSRQLDDVGGPGGSKPVQSVLPVASSWGLDTGDQTDRLNVAYTYQLPVGKGRQFMGTPSGFGGKALDYVIGGWQVAGNWTFTTGTPITLASGSNGNINNTIKVNQTFPSYANPSNTDLTPSGYGSDQPLLYGPEQAIPSLTSSAPRRLDPNAVVNVQAFILGNLPINSNDYRNPSFHQMDISIEKNFRITESRYLQIRAEGQNAFNIRGFGNYNSSINWNGTPNGSGNYGLITTAGNSPRQIQLSARINF